MIYKCFILQLTTVTVQIKFWFVNLMNHVSLCKTIHESVNSKKKIIRLTYNIYITLIKPYKRVSATPNMLLRLLH